MDLARATGCAWNAPTRGVEATLRLLSDLALETGRSDDLVMVLSDRNSGDVLPLLR